MADNKDKNENKDEQFGELESESLTKGEEQKQEKKTNKFVNFFKSFNHSKISGIDRTPFKARLKNFFHINDKVASKESEFFKKLKNWWPLSKISGRIFLMYAIAIVIGLVLLAIPGVVQGSGKTLNGGTHSYDWDFLTSWFTTSSAFSDTGITIANTATNYTFWGQLIIALLIEIGGIGILTFKIVLYLALDRKISMSDTTLAQTERGSTTLSSAVVLIRDGFVWLTCVQLLSALILFFGFYFTDPADQLYYVKDGANVAIANSSFDMGTSAYHNFAQSLWDSIFHSTSAINNAGFDIISGNSLQPYNQPGHMGYMIQIVFMLEWIIGGLGYPTFHDIKKKIKSWKTGEYVKFSLFTKLNFIVYAVLLIVGPLGVWGFEASNADHSLIYNYVQYGADGNSIEQWLGRKSNGQIAMDIIFNTTSTRNAGFSTLNMNDFNGGSKIVMSVLMFIGSAPSSTAGGIRTTTLAVIVLANWSIVRDRNQVTVFKKSVPDKTVRRAFGVFFISVIICIVAVAIIFGDSHNELADHSVTGDSSVIETLMLVTSAFGTVGMNPFSGEQTLAMGAFSKVILIIVMLVGQLGISNLLQLFVKSSSQRQYGYLEEDVTIG